MKTYSAHWSFRPLVAVCVLAVVSVGWSAQRRPGGSNYGRKGNSGAKSAAAARAAATAAQKELTSARQQWQASQAQLVQARQQQKSTGKQVREKHSTSPEVTAALQEMKLAQSEYEAAKKPILGKLARETDYQAAVAKRDAARKQLEKLRKSSSKNRKLLKAASAKAVELGAVVSKIETKAFKESPVVEKAKSKLTAARKRNSSARRALEEARRRDPQLKAARDSVKAAEGAVKTAERGIALATQKLAIASRNAALSQLLSRGGRGNSRNRSPRSRPRPK